MMSYPRSEDEPSAMSSDFNRSQEASRAGDQSLRGHPLPLILLALLVGAVLGAHLSRRKKKQKDAVHVAKEWLDATYEQLAEKVPQLTEKLPQLTEKVPQLAEKLSQLAEKLSQLAEKLPRSKEPAALSCQAAFLEQVRQVGRNPKL
jgi:X-X-X-Leu-X-X-Gly heptad repeat protein